LHLDFDRSAENIERLLDLADDTKSARGAKDGVVNGEFWDAGGTQPLREKRSQRRRCGRRIGISGRS